MKKIYHEIILVGLILLINIVNAQTWTRKADFGGSGRYFATGFVIDNKGYIGLGTDSAVIDKNDFWEYDPKTDTWIRKKDFPGLFIESSVGLSIGNKGYIATDQDGNFWEYDPVLNKWTQKADYPGPIVSAVAFSIGEKGYIATGEYSRQLWEWDGDEGSPTYNTWTQKAPFPLLAGRYAATAFSIGTKGYIATGTDGQAEQNDLWEWDGDNTSETYDTWTQKAFLPGQPRAYALSFSIGSYCFIGGGLAGWTGSLLSDFWRWDQATNTWTQMPDLPGPSREAAVSFVIDNIGYIGTGYGSYGNSNLKDFWAFCDTCYAGIHDHATAGILVYPNPASEILHIRTLDLRTESTAEIYHIFGNQVFARNFNGEAELDVSGLRTGFYILIIKNNHSLYSTKLIIER
jgi:N-acetylneuraminic acid mutarotase